MIEVLDLKNCQTLRRVQIDYIQYISAPVAHKINSAVYSVFMYNSKEIFHCY